MQPLDVNAVMFVDGSGQTINMTFRILQSLKSNELQQFRIRLFTFILSLLYAAKIFGSSYGEARPEVDDSKYLIKIFQYNIPIFNIMQVPAS